MTASTPGGINRGERLLAFLIIAIVGLSLLAFIAVIVATAMGVGNNDGFSEGIWPVVIMLPLIGLPVSFVLIIALLILSAIRRGRAAKSNGG